MAVPSHTILHVPFNAWVGTWRMERGPAGAMSLSRQGITMGSEIDVAAGSSTATTFAFVGESVGVAVVGSREGLAEGFTVGCIIGEREDDCLRLISPMKLHDERWRNLRSSTASL